jgi:hypothetical protein
VCVWGVVVVVVVVCVCGGGRSFLGFDVRALLP